MSSFLCSGVGFCSHCRRANSHFLSAAYLAFQLCFSWEMCLSAPHATLCSSCRGHLGPRAHPLARFAFMIHVPGLRPGPPLSSAILCDREARSFPAWSHQCFLRGQDSRQEKGTNDWSALPASWGGEYKQWTRRGLACREHDDGVGRVLGASLHSSGPPPGDGSVPIFSCSPS